MTMKRNHIFGIIVFVLVASIWGDMLWTGANYNGFTLREWLTIDNVGSGLMLATLAGVMTSVSTRMLLEAD